MLLSLKKGNEMNKLGFVLLVTMWAKEWVEIRGGLLDAPIKVDDSLDPADVIGHFNTYTIILLIFVQ